MGIFLLNNKQKIEKLNKNKHDIGQICKNCGQHHTCNQDIIKHLKNISVYKFKDFYNREFQNYREQRTVKKQTNRNHKIINYQKVQKKVKKYKVPIKDQNSSYEILEDSHKTLLKDYSNQLNFQLSSIQHRTIELSCFQKSSFWRNYYKQSCGPLNDFQVSRTKSKLFFQAIPLLHIKNSLIRTKYSEKQYIILQNGNQAQLKVGQNKQKKAHNFVDNVQNINKRQNQQKTTQQQCSQQEKIEDQVITTFDINSFNYQSNSYNKKSMKYQPTKQQKQTDFNIQKQSKKTENYEQSNLFTGFNPRYNLVEQQLKYTLINRKRLIKDQQRWYSQKEQNEIKSINEKNEKHLKKQIQVVRIKRPQQKDEVVHKNSFWDNRCCGFEFLQEQDHVDKQTQAFLFQVDLNEWQ